MNPVPPGYGQFTGFQPLPGAPGAYGFQTPNGGQYTFTGQPAEELAKRIALAQQSGAAPAAPPAAPAQAAPQPEKYQLLTTEKDGTQIFLKPGGDPRNPQHLIKETPGRAATKGGLALRTQTEQGGFTPNKELVEQYVSGQRAEQQLMEEGRKEASAMSLRRQGFIEEAQARATQEATRRENEMLVAKNEVAAIRAKYDQAEKDFLTERDAQENPMKDPKKAGRMVIGGLVGSLAASLGALGATVGRTPNFAAETLERDAERRMRSDQARLRVRAEAKDNMYAQLKDQLGSAALADNAYMSIKARQDALGLEMLASQEQAFDRQQSLLQAAGMRRESGLKYLIELDRVAQGEVTKNLVNVPGSAGSAARRTGVSLDEAAKLGNIAATAASTDKTRADTAATLNPQLDPQQRSAQVERTNALSAAGNAIDAARRIELNLKARKMGADNTADDPLSGGIDALASGVSALRGSDRVKLNNQLRADTFALARGAQTALGKSDNDALMADKMAEGGGSAADRLRAAKDISDRAIKTIQAELSTLPPAQAQQLLSTLSPEAKKAVLGQ